jgi:hypothetical protein
MPMGPAPLGFAYFVGVKFVGYTVAAFVIRKSYPEFKGGFVKVGAARTAIGIGAGLAYGALWFLIGSKAFGTADPGPVSYFAGLLPVRIAEWMWLIHLFFDKGLGHRRKAFKTASAGTVWSYCLDAIGIAAAFVIPGGVWVC